MNGEIDIAHAVQEGQPLLWTGLSGSSKTFELLRQIGSQNRNVFTGPITIFVCPNEAQAVELHEQASFFQRSLYVSIPLLFYPARETDFVPSQYQSENIVDQRLVTLYRALENKPVIIITSLKALAQKTLPHAIFKKHIHALMLHDEPNRDELIKQFVDAGYERESTTRNVGDFSVRGDIIDFFTPNFSNPIRVEFFGDRIERMCQFDPDTQISSADQLEYVEWLPAHEILLSDVDAKSVLRKIKNRADDLNLPPEIRAHLEESVREKILLPAMDHLFPIFYEQEESLLNYIPSNANWMLFDPLSLKTEIQNIEFEFQKGGKESKKLQSKAQDFLMNLETVEKTIIEKTGLYISEVDFTFQVQTQHVPFSNIVLNQDIQSELIQNKKTERPYSPLAKKFSEWNDKGLATYIVASESSFERIQKLLQPYLPEYKFEKVEHIVEEHRQPFRINLIVGDMHYGFESPFHKIVLLTEAEIFGEQKFKQAKIITQENMLESLSELEIGDPVVHIDHGIGLYQGLQKMTIANVEHDFLVIQYLGDDKLFLPVYRLNRIHKYISADGKKAKVDKLGGQNWEAAKKKAQKAIEEMAQELIELYAKRKIAKGYSYGQPDETYTEFEVEFPFEETRDQLKTIEEIFSDLQSDKPMDRLVCGDVGFGKTEVALRAAFRVASEGKQVAVLVPTTILCQQHYETFKKRFANFPFEIDFLSRFKDRKDALETIANLKTGNLDIVIGTHRILSKDVEFSNLGLLILDEEHRFGVKHKEHIKKFRNKIDVLTLTATPIPRTLQLSMTGIRDLSVINTPPLDRKAVHTILCNFDDGTIRNAITKELARKGQIFFLHNRVESIYTMKQYIEKIVPNVRIRVGHGQMNQHELEKTMLDFLNHEFDLLLCTTIIESGIDVPNANTLIVNRADTFGLSQLYQIRGRVGRSHQEAFAYFMVPDRDRMSRDAVKRLKVLKQFTDLGSGLKISLHDLEIRGAGNLLGSKQSGQISTVGFELYSQLLEREIRKLKGEKVQEEIEPEIQVNIAAYIPDEYIDEQNERLRFYKRLSGCKNEEEMSTIRSEMIDRFGALPPVVENLLEVVDLKITARECGVTTLKVSGFSPVIEFADHAPINVDKLLEMARKNPNVRFTPDQKLHIGFDSDLDPIAETKKVLASLKLHGKT